MQMVKKIIGSFFLLLIFLVIFAPKEQIYYLLEKKLSKEGIVISNEKFSDNLYGVTISDADIYFEGINIAKVQTIDLKILFLYDELKIESVKIDKGIQNILPKYIDNLSATYSIIKPNKIILKGAGSFGELEGYIDLNKIFIRITNPKDISSIRKFLKKDKEGLYYEESFRK